MLKVAILEASHWHVPLYLAGLSGDGIEVVAISDAENSGGPDGAAGQVQAVSDHFRARVYSDYQTLLENEAVDFAFVFGRHCNMAEMAQALIDKGIGFSIEKPGGMNAPEVATFERSAMAAGVFVSVPFILRVSDLLGALRPLGGPGRANWQHMSFRFIGGPIERYIQMKCRWMLDKCQAGGGVTANLGVHFIDLVHYLTGEDVAHVSALMQRAQDGADVEVFSTLRLQTSSGVICNLESGYTYPGGTSEQREVSYTVASDTHYARSVPGGLHLTHRAGAVQETIAVAMETDDYYALYAGDVLARFQAGNPPAVGVRDLRRVMQVVDAAYASAGQGGKVITLGDTASSDQAGDV